MEEWLTHKYQSQGDLPNGTPHTKGVDYHLGKVLITTDVVLGIINTMTVVNGNNTEVKARVFVNGQPVGEISASPGKSGFANVGYPCGERTRIHVVIMDAWLNNEIIETIIVK